MIRPSPPPIGLQLAGAARAVGRAFDGALAEAGGSLPVWLVLLNLKTRRITKQRELAHAVGLTEATVTHHLNALEADGLLTRRREDGNRRVQVIELTDAGEGAFLRLRDVAIAFDRRLRGGVTAEELAGFAAVLDRLRTNAAPGA